MLTTNTMKNLCQLRGNRKQHHYQLLKIAWRGISKKSQSLQTVSPEMTSISSPEFTYTKDPSCRKSIEVDWEHAKPFRDIPGPTTYQMVRGYMKGGEFENSSLIDLLTKCRQKYGDIYLLPGIGKKPILSIFDPVDFEKLHRTEGKYPHRPGTEAISFYREKRKDDFFKGSLGLAGMDKEWGDFRTKVNPVLMKTQNARLYLEPMIRVNDDFVQHIREIRDPITQEVPDNFATDLTHLALESVAVVALDTRLGFIRGNKSQDIDGETQKLFDCLVIFIESVYDLGIKPGFYKYFPTPTYRRFEKALDHFFDISKKYIDQAVDRIERQDAADAGSSVLEQLLKIDRKVAMMMAMDMMQGGVETTSSILAGALLLLASHPDKQAKLRNEVLHALSGDKKGHFTYENMQHLPYLRACVKEAMRIYPLTSGNFRSAGQDIVLGGYRVPKGTRVVLNSNLLLSEERYFPRAKEFIPERWLRGSDSEGLMAKNISSFVFLPFGFGPRTCVGKRIANLELELTLANLVRNFSMEFNYSRENAFKSKFISFPAIPLKFKFTDL